MPADDGVGRKKEKLSQAAREAALKSLLERHPEAWVVAIAPSGHFTEMPESVPLRGQRVVQGPSSALELVAPDERNAVVEAWAQAVVEGGSNLSVHAYGDAERVINLHFIDATERYGVFVGVFLGYGEDAEPEAAEPEVLVPRTSVLRKDRVGIILSADAAATAILGWRADELVGHRSLEFVHPDDQERAVANWMDMFGRPGSSQRVRLRHRHKNGSWVWLEVTNHNRLDDPDDPCVLADNVDVTEEVAALDALQANERVLRRLTEALPVGVLYVNADRTMDYGNERLAAIVGISSASTVEEQFATVVGEDHETLMNALSTVLEQGRDADLNVSFLPRPDTVVHCDLSLRALTNDAKDVVGAIICVSDVTEDLRMREELKERASYDLLTGCLNHASVMSALDERLAEARDGLTVALYVDLDDFKEINDRYGHAIGDRVLRQVADDLHGIAHGENLVGRLGGDEFLVALHSVDDQALTTIATQMAEALRHDVQWDDTRIAMRASVGVSYARAGSGVSADHLVSTADEAMYTSKRSNGAPVVVNATQPSALRRRSFR